MSTKFSNNLKLNNIAIAKVFVLFDWPSYSHSSICKQVERSSGETLRVVFYRTGMWAVRVGQQQNCKLDHSVITSKPCVLVTWRCIGDVDSVLWIDIWLNIVSQWWQTELLVQIISEVNFVFGFILSISLII